MNKERDLLKRWFSGEANQMPTLVPLLIETQNLLDQPEQEPLSDDEIDILWGNEKAIGLYSFARVIEKHHGITGADSE